MNKDGKKPAKPRFNTFHKTFTSINIVYTNCLHRFQNIVYQISANVDFVFFNSLLFGNGVIFPLICPYYRYENMTLRHFLLLLAATLFTGFFVEAQQILPSTKKVLEHMDELQLLNKQEEALKVRISVLKRHLRLPIWHISMLTKAVFTLI